MEKEWAIHRYMPFFPEIKCEKMGLKKIPCNTKLIMELKKEGEDCGRGKSSITGMIS